MNTITLPCETVEQADEELSLILSDSESKLSHGATRAINRVRAALSQQGEPQIRLVDGDWPIIALGYGRVEVAEGWQGETHALIFGRNGMGQIGAPTQPDRVHLPGETLAVITFANVESLDVVAGKLSKLREKLGLSKQEPQAQITYAHPSNPSGPRFNQRANDPLPVWAVDVRPEPQAQAGEPDNINWVDYARVAEAIAKKDAALKACVEALDGIRRYGLDTLSGRTDGPDDRDWQRQAVNEMTKRAIAAITQSQEVLK